MQQQAKINWQEKADQNLQSVLQKLNANWSVVRNEKGELILVHNDGRIVKVPKKANYSHLAALIV